MIPKAVAISVILTASAKRTPPMTMATIKGKAWLSRITFVKLITWVIRAVSSAMPVAAANSAVRGLKIAGTPGLVVTSGVKVEMIARNP